MDPPLRRPFLNSAAFPPSIPSSTPSRPTLTLTVRHRAHFHILSFIYLFILAVLRAVYEAGFGFECVSPGEVKHVLALFPGLKLIDSAAPATTTSPFRGGRLLFTPNFAPRSTNLF